ncbi:MAG: [LysW]-aminoadipate kinase [Gammaproteobacteria bacterium]|nr:[LysW]-aminoadipate kinase [Gammaproteobacteria bacterium]
MYIIKVGGGASINLQGVADDLAALDAPALVVLGANAVRDGLAERLGTPRQTITSQSGYTSVLSDEAAIDAILMAYAGLRAKRFVELCQQRGVNALSLSGIDGQLVRGERNKGIRVREGGKNLIKRDFSGKPRSANGALLRLLLDNGYVPVLTIPILDERGYAINSENDDIVNVLQESLQAECIVQLIEAPGFLDDADDENSVLRHLSRAEVDAREAQLEGRIKRKMLALKRLLESGATRVVIADGRIESPIRQALAGHGTLIGQG